MAQAIDNSSGQLPATRTLHDSFTRAEEYAARRKHAVVGLDHLLLALLDDENARSIMFACQVDIEAMRADLLKKLGPEARGFTHDAIPPGFDITVQNIVSHASMAARQSGKNVVDGTNILAAIISGEGGIISHNLLQRYGLTFEDAINVMNSYEAESSPPRPRLASDRTSDRTLEKPQDRKSELSSNEVEYRAPQQRSNKGEAELNKDPSTQELPSSNNYTAMSDEPKSARPAQAQQPMSEEQPPSDQQYVSRRQEPIPSQQSRDEMNVEETEELFDPRQADLFEQLSQHPADHIYEDQNIYGQSDNQSLQTGQRSLTEKKQNPYKPNFHREDEDRNPSGQHWTDHRVWDEVTYHGHDIRSGEPGHYQQQHPQLQPQSQPPSHPQGQSRPVENGEVAIGPETRQSQYREGHDLADHTQFEGERSNADQSQEAQRHPHAAYPEQNVGHQPPPAYSGHDNYLPNQATYQPPPPPQTNGPAEDAHGQVGDASVPPYSPGQVTEDYRQSPAPQGQPVASPQLPQSAQQGYAEPPAMAGIPSQASQIPPQAVPQTPAMPPAPTPAMATADQSLLPAPYTHPPAQPPMPNLPAAPTDFAHQPVPDPSRQRPHQPQLTHGEMTSGEPLSSDKISGEMVPAGLPQMSPEQYPESRQETGERLHDLAQSIQQNRQGLKSRDQDEGQIIENIPASMRRGALEFVEVRVARYSDMEIEMGMQNYGLKSIRQEGKITKALTVRLSGAEGQFMIEPLTSQTQWIEHQSNLVDNADFAIWRWKVMPLKSGPAKLRLDVCLRSFKDDGLSGEIPLQPTQNFEIKVKRNYGRGFLKLMIWGLFFALGATAMLFQDRLLQIFENLMAAI